VCATNAQSSTNSKSRITEEQNSASHSVYQLMTAVHVSLKIDKIRASAPTIDVRSASTTPLSNFRPVDAVEIVRVLSCTPAKHCHLDSVPAWLVKRAAVVLAPVLSLICNASLRSGMFPNLRKPAIVFPQLKKPSLNADDLNS